jgi:hypothetical protein
MNRGFKIFLFFLGEVERLSEDMDPDQVFDDMILMGISIGIECGVK